MKKNVLLGLLLAVLFCFDVQSAAGQVEPLPYLRTVEVNASARYEADTDFYYYEYNVENGAASNGAINYIEIDLTKNVSNSTLDTIGLRFKGSYIENKFRRIYPKLSGRVIPVGFPALPQYGDAGLTVRNSVMFSASIIRPGEAIGGFVMMSEAPPGIRTFKVMPLYNPNDHYPPISKLDTKEAIDSVMTQVRLDYEVRLPVRGKTLGPRAPVAPFDALRFLDTLRTYPRRAADLGWIDNRGILRSLQVKLDNAERQLERGNTDTAVNVLRAFINEVEAQRGKHLSSEAYALLKYNAKYLIDRLRDQ